MKREENKKNESNVQTEQKGKIIRVRSGLRAGAMNSVVPCI